MQPEQNINTNTTSSTETNKLNLKNYDFSKIKKALNLKTILILFVLVIMSLMGYLSKKYIFAATVNGRGITRLEVIRELERRAGKEVVENLINTELVKQEANSRKIYVMEDELKAKTNEIDSALKERGQSLEVALKEQNLTEAQFKKIIETNLLLEKMIAGLVEVTDKEVDDYIEANKEILPTDINPDELKQQIKESLMSQKLNAESQTFITNLRTKANVVFWVNY